MCTVSMVAQDWFDRNPRWTSPPFVPAPSPPPFNPVDLAKIMNPQYVSRAEFDVLKAEMESLKKLLTAAKQYDKETAQADCEDADKIALLRKLAQLVGVDINDVFPVTK